MLWYVFAPFFFFSTPVASIADRRIRFVPHRKQHTDPDYSCVYVKIATAEGLEGYGMTFTLGRGTDIVLLAVRALKHLVEGRTTASIFERFGAFWRELTSDSQLRWVSSGKLASTMDALQKPGSLAGHYTPADWTGERCHPSGGGRHHQRPVGPVG